jgi:hypothetical protein
MKQKENSAVNRLRNSLLRVSRIHYVLVAILGVQIIFYDAWHLITLESVMQRWIATAVLLAVTTVVWYFARNKIRDISAYKWLTALLIITDIALASFLVYTQRGMASRAVMLYAIPIVVSAILLSRSALFATAALCIAAYFATTITYFVVNFNEGYKIELYGEVGFYSAIFMIIAALLWQAVRTKKNY